jgi:hypothetical protein
MADVQLLQGEGNVRFSQAVTPAHLGGQKGAQRWAPLTFVLYCHYEI